MTLPKSRHPQISGSKFNADENIVTTRDSLYQAMNHPFKKAAFMLFLVSEVHPFIDGNGRVARIKR
jgi:Fic family protein